MNALDIYDCTETLTLMSTVELIEKPATFLTTTFFPNVEPFFYSTKIAIEFRHQGRMLAPYVVAGTRGVNVGRGTSQIIEYSAPMFGVRRVIGQKDVEMRQFGELPIFSTLKAEDRARIMQAQDLNDLLAMHANRKERMAADILQYGKTTMRAYADDGKVTEVEEIDFNFKNKASTDWTASTAKIYEELRTVSDRIQQRTGTIPTMAVCGKGVEEMLMNNAEIRNWLMLPNRENLAMASFAPHYTESQCRYIGRISALNMDFVSYGKTYYEADGTVKPYIDDYTVIIANAHKGRILRGSMVFFEDDGKWHTYAADYVPRYTFDREANQSSLAIFARYLPVPSLLDDHFCLQVHP